MKKNIEIWISSQKKTKIHSSNLCLQIAMAIVREESAEVTPDFQEHIQYRFLGVAP